MLRRLKHTGLAMMATVAFAATAQAQIACGATGVAGGPASCSVNGSVTGTMQRIVRLTLTPTNFGLTMPTDVDFAVAGTVQKVDAAAQVALVRANATWSLTIQSAAAWTGTGNTAAKAIGDLEWTSDAGVTYTPISATAANLATAQPKTAGTNVNVGYRTSWSLANDSPGTYSLALTFTLTAP
jgi:hypothetical protein